MLTRHVTIELRLEFRIPADLMGFCHGLVE